MAWLERLRAATMLTVAGFAIASAVQAGCSGQVDRSSPTPDGGPTCLSGQTAEQLGAHAVCCTGNGGALSCVQAEELTGGMPCTTPGATAQGDGFEVVLDQCVTESCTGDRTGNPYPQQTTRQQGTVVCQAGPAGATWQWQGPTEKHVVVRTCLVTGQATCSLGDCGYDVYGYPYNCPTVGTPEHGYDYYGYYSYYEYGPISVPVRAVRVASSACTDAQGNTSTCDVGDL
jgi:hypothetical protein